ncbi:MAG: DUF1570 domain-containing protein [Thermoguttaceae bacterium]
MTLTACPKSLATSVLIFVVWMVWLPPSESRGEELLQTVQNLQTKYATKLKELAAWCDEKGLKEQDAATLDALGPHDCLKFYMPILPVHLGADKSPKDASPEIIEWDSRLKQLRREHAAALVELAKRAARMRQAGLTLQLVLQAAHANPDNSTARHFLGYQKFQNQWHTPYEIKKLRSGMIWSDKFGWLPKNQLRRYEQGKRFYEGRWISAAEDARRHRTIETSWAIETEHYTIHTDRSLEAGVALGVKLETLCRLWQRMFFGYYAPQADVLGMFDQGEGNPIPVTPRHRVVYFRNRNEYNRSLKPAIPDIEISIGLYLDSMRTAYFFAGNGSDDRTIYHEATHQLFHESRDVSPDVGRKGNFWIVEGIAMYMESLKTEKGFLVLGGFDDDRVAAARYRLLHDHFYIPLVQLTKYDMERLQKDPKIKTIYSQAAGLTYFLIHYDCGRYRDALAAYLTAVYTGQDGPDTLSQLTGKAYSELDKEYRQFMEAKK